MVFPDSPVGRALQAVYARTSISVVTVEAVSISPLSLMIRVCLEERIDITCDIALPDHHIWEVEEWVQELAWATGAFDMRRLAHHDPHPTVGAPYSWMWKPSYRRKAGVLRARRRRDPSLDEDGGRSDPYPYYQPMSLLEAARAYPPTGVGKMRGTIFEFGRWRS